LSCNYGWRFWIEIKLNIQAQIQFSRDDRWQSPTKFPADNGLFISTFHFTIFGLIKRRMGSELIVSGESKDIGTAQQFISTEAHK